MPLPLLLLLAGGAVAVVVAAAAGSRPERGRATRDGDNEGGDSGGDQQQSGGGYVPEDWDAHPFEANQVWWSGEWRTLPTRGQGAAACFLVTISGGIAAVDELTRFRCRAHKREAWRE